MKITILTFFLLVSTCIFAHRGEWAVSLDTDTFTSYTKPGYCGPCHCTVWKNSNDIHCKKAGNKKCGFFNGVWQNNNAVAETMYNDFMTPAPVPVAQ